MQDEKNEVLACGVWTFCPQPENKHGLHVTTAGLSSIFCATTARKEDGSPIVCETFLTMFHLSRPFYMSSASNMDSLLLHILHDAESQTHPPKPIHNHLEIYLPTTGRFKRNNCDNNHNHCLKNNCNNTHHCHHLSIQYFELLQTRLHDP